MIRSRTITILALILLTGLTALAADQDKSRKELDKVTALATDATGRRMVNVSMAQVLNAKRYDLIMERRSNEINYGSLFLMHQLINNGGKAADISAQLTAGKTIYQIADEQHADWKKVLDQAKALNAKIDDNLYKHFSVDPKETKKQENAEDEAANYNIIYDGVKADNDVSQSEISKAQDRYLALRNRGEEYAKRGNRLSTADQNAAYRDNARSGGPQSQGGGSGGAAPAAGGVR